MPSAAERVRQVIEAKEAERRVAAEQFSHDYRKGVERVEREKIEQEKARWEAGRPAREYIERCKEILLASGAKVVLEDFRRELVPHAVIGEGIRISNEPQDSFEANVSLHLVKTKYRAKTYSYEEEDSYYGEVSSRTHTETVHEPVNYYQGVRVEAYASGRIPLGIKLTSYDDDELTLRIHSLGVSGLANKALFGGISVKRDAILVLAMKDEQMPGRELIGACSLNRGSDQLTDLIAKAIVESGLLEN